MGGLHVLAGRNGAGKSTVLSAVALLGDHPNPFAGLTELGLEATESRRLGHPRGSSDVAVRIYELDDDLSASAWLIADIQLADTRIRESDTRFQPRARW